ncbi:MAG: endolytic transglycosylase MltG, partial [Bacteroidales bacterium]|nr:endolytic transglycosylase MltG [Bacteroidales bacterium]
SVVPAFQDTVVFYIRTGTGFTEVIGDLKAKGWLRYPKGFEWVAARKNYPVQVKPGRYELHRGMSNSELVDLLRSGHQTEVKLIFHTTRSLEHLAGVIGRQLEPDSLAMLIIFRDSQLYSSFGFAPENHLALFIPNTYHFFWNTSPKAFMKRMYREYENFWKGKRDQQAAAIGLSRFEVMTLASIVQEETSKTDEMPVIAGVYMNRLHRGIRLQADPTVIYALGGPKIKRVLHRHLKVQSLYNTYRHKGLPPGPIRIPSITAIDACLHYAHHNYLYFCARDDFSGYHLFASRYAEHLRNARKYRRALDQQ